MSVSTGTLLSVLEPDVKVAQGNDQDDMAVPAVSPPPAMTANIENLTEREKVVLRLIGECLSAKQIADVLAISPRTAEFHVKNIKQRLGLESSKHLLRFAVEQGAVLSAKEKSNAF
jgi:DNA-binding CsgD family transcriptional regulator